MKREYPESLLKKEIYRPKNASVCVCVRERERERDYLLILTACQAVSSCFMPRAYGIAFVVQGVSIYVGPMWLLITLLLIMLYSFFLISDLKKAYYKKYSSLITMPWTREEKYIP